jgi:hypothetical protein
VPTVGNGRMLALIAVGECEIGKKQTMRLPTTACFAEMKCIE